MEGLGDQRASLSAAVSWSGTTDVTRQLFLELVTEHSNTSIYGSKGNCSRYVLFPGEKNWKYEGRAFVYTVVLLYFFVGMSAITAVFMKSIETIVLQTRQVKWTNPVTRASVVKRERIWNSTLADITLLALGTSAPPLAISIIDAFQQLGQTEDSGLGPGTIVGSAAFNVFPILAVCVLVPKNGTVKKIGNLGVYVVELAWSMWAYIWLLIILQFSSPGSINTWEALFTVWQFPLLMLHVYAQDKGWPFVSIPFPRGQDESSFRQMSTELSRVESGHSVGLPEATAVQSGTDPEQKKPAWLGQSELMGTDPHTPFQRLSSSGESGRVEDDMSPVSGSFRVSIGNEEEHLSWGDITLAWKQQFVDALRLKGSNDASGKELSPSWWQTSMHYMSLPWRIVFACNPPASLGHGWFTFCSTIICIIGLSIAVIKVVHVLGCVTGINAFVLAITVLAAGTSWPDLVATKIAVEHSDVADSAMANINASNSINIYIGIGVPWLIHSFHNRLVHSENFKTPANGLSFSVVVYFILLILCVLVVTIRRIYFGGELGGPRGWAWASSVFFFSLWVLFIIFSCLYHYGII